MAGESFKRFREITEIQGYFIEGDYVCPECGEKTILPSGFNGNPFCWGTCYHYFRWEQIKTKKELIAEGREMNYKIEQLKTDLEYVISNATHLYLGETVMGQRAEAFMILIRKGLSPEQAAEELMCSIEEARIYECVPCGTTFYARDGEHKNGYLVCPSCWDEDLREV